MYEPWGNISSISLVKSIPLRVYKYKLTCELVLIAISNYKKSHVGFIKKYSLDRAREILDKFFKLDSNSNETKLYKIDFEILCHILYLHFGHPPGFHHILLQIMRLQSFQIG